MTKTIYVIMASFNQGRDWAFCLDRAGNIVSCETYKQAQYLQEETYRLLKADAERLHVKHIPRKHFRIITYHAEAPQRSSQL